MTVDESGVNSVVDKFRVGSVCLWYSKYVPTVSSVRLVVKDSSQNLCQRYKPSKSGYIV